MRRNRPLLPPCALVVALALFLASRVSFAGEIIGTEAARERLYPNVVEPELIIGGYGSRPGEFLQIRKVMFRDNESFYVADCGADRIQEFDLRGALRSVLRHPCPSDVAISGTRLVVFSEQAGTISLYDQETGKHLRAWQVPTQGEKRITAIAANSSLVFAIPQYGGQLIAFDVFGRPLKHLSIPSISRVSAAVVAGDEVFLTDKFGSRVYAANYQTGKVRHFGEFGTYAGELANPHGLDVHKDTIYVVDTVNHRIQRFNTQGEFQLQFGRHPVSPHETTMGRMHYPHHIAVSPNGAHAVVCEPFESRCNIFLVSKVEHKYSSSSESAWWNKFFYFHYRGPSSIKKFSSEDPPLENDLLFMGEEDIHRIVIAKIVDGVPETVTAFGELGSGPGQFRGPEGVFPGPKGNLYVVDTGNNRVQVFDFQGNFKFQFGELGSKPGQLNSPGQGSTDAEGRVYIADAGNSRIQVFDANGRYLRHFGVRGRNPGQLLRPIDAHVDKQRNRIMVVDLYGKRVSIYSLDGKYMFSLGSGAPGSAQLIAPHSVVVDDTTGSIFVSDMVANSILKFDLSGKFRARIGSYGLALGEFKTPAGLAAADGRVYVMDHTNHRGQALNARTGSPLFAFGEGIIGIPGDVLSVRRTLDEMSARFQQQPATNEESARELQRMRTEIEALRRQLNTPLAPK